MLGSNENSFFIVNVRTVENAPRDILTLNNHVLFKVNNTVFSIMSRGAFSVALTFTMKFEFVAELSSLSLSFYIYIYIYIYREREREREREGERERAQEKTSIALYLNGIYFCICFLVQNFKNMY